MKKKKIFFSKSGKKKVEAIFSGGNLTQDAGLLIIKEIDKKIGLTKQISKQINDRRSSGYIRHTVQKLLLQRVIGLIGGYEDLNDHDHLRNDNHFQHLLDSEEPLASSSTLSRFENSVSKQDINRMQISLIDRFVSSYKAKPREIVLDFDPTDCLIYGNQEKRFYHGYYGDYCFLPLHVFSGDKLVTTILKSSDKDPSKYAGAILKITVEKIRSRWPDMKITFRGDAAFARKHILHWCEMNKVKYIVGIGGNKRLQDITNPELQKIKNKQSEKQDNQREYFSFFYRAKSWPRFRRIISKIECNINGLNRRFLVTNDIFSSAEELYTKEYCPRGDMENKIKQLKLDLFGDRLSCHNFSANQVRNILTALAYIIVEELRSIYLKGTELAQSYCNKIMLKLMKVSGVIIEKKTKITYLLSSNYPFQFLFTKVSKKVAPG